MKRLVLLSMILFCSMSYGQTNDTIFFKSGEVVPVYKITGISEGQLTYYSNKDQSDDEQQSIDTSYVKRYSQFLSTPALERAYDIEGAYFEKNKGKSELDYKTGWIQYNLKHFNSEEGVSRFFYGLGIVSGGVYAYDPVKYKNLLYVAAGLGSVGLIIHLNSYKWIKRASIQTSFSGVSLKMKL